jgi:drug/metabolite transporter (DMT)-like permease
MAAVAVIAFSTSPVFVLAATPLSPFVITFGRLAVAAAGTAVLGRLSRQRFLPERAHLPLFAGFGFITALHFLSYIASLSFTTIAQSLAIVYTAPIFVTIFSATLLHEPISRHKWLGVIVAVAGIAILVGFEPRMDWRMAFGDLLALASAITFGLYSVAGRSWRPRPQRAHYGLFTYTCTVYGMAALWALPAAALTFSPAGVETGAVAALLAAGVIPLGIGHTLYNAALRRTHATVVNLIASQEVTGGVLLGALFLGRMPQGNELVGAAVALVGIALVLI